ncbi:MBL fold metallo-hydrolase [Mesonia ostreae]|uniref:MBL fold metallo-hydrolase n=1 Tax=Mesonia ostreae TaxID=861110 RepID=A0ABU2KMD7_9FLAO|nr:MBL fold metallo-hydrolase [Mesonia ostreae]MDT0295873.1 MBL fold metallo-hydrolase [Mesonia ostreae]
MKRTFREIILTFSLCLIATFGFTQSKEIQIEFLGNCGLYLTDGTTNIYTDFPYKSGAHGYMEFDESELDSIKDNSIFIFTHKHSDHYSKKNLKKVIREKGGTKYGVSNISELEKLNNTLNDFEIKAFKTKHKVFGINFRHYSYLITWHGKKIYLSGDTTNPETIGKVKNIDLAFIPYWLYENAKEQNIEIDADEIGIYHLHPLQIEPAEKFFKEKENEHPLTEKGKIITIEL